MPRKVCAQRRSELSAIIEQSELETSFPTLGGPGAAGQPREAAPDSLQEAEDAAHDFPTLGPGVAGPGAGWGRGKQAPPGHTGRPAADDFPTLGGGAGGRGAAPEAQWGASSSARAAAREAPSAADEPGQYRGMSLEEWAGSGKAKKAKQPDFSFPELSEGSAPQSSQEAERVYYMIVCVYISLSLYTYVYIHIYIYIYTHTYIYYIYIHVYIHIYTCVCDIYIYIYTHTYIHTYSTYTYMYMHTYIHTCIHIHIHVYTCVYTYICMYVYMYIHVYIYIYIYRHT